MDQNIQKQPTTESSQSLVPNAPQASVKSSKSRLWVAGILLLEIAVVGGIFSFILLPQKSFLQSSKVNSSQTASSASLAQNNSTDAAVKETSSWKTGTSSSCYVSYKYPDNWTEVIQHSISKTSQICLVSLEGQKTNIVNNYQYDQSIIGITNEWFGTLTKEEIIGDLKSHGYTLTKVDGLDAYKEPLTKVLEGHYTEEVVVPKGDMFFTFYIHQSQSKPDMSIFDSFLSTVHFTGTEENYKVSAVAKSLYTQSMQGASLLVSKANNSARKSDVVALKQAIDYAIKDSPNLLSKLTTTPQEIAKSKLDICNDLVPKSIYVLPQDVKLKTGVQLSDCSTNYDTGYTAYLDGSTVVVGAPLAENGEVITSEIVIPSLTPHPSP